MFEQKIIAIAIGHLLSDSRVAEEQFSHDFYVSFIMFLKRARAAHQPFCKKGHKENVASAKIMRNILPKVAIGTEKNCCMPLCPKNATASAGTNHNLIMSQK